MWSEHVLNPQLIKSIFKGTTPSLEHVELRELKLMYGEDLMCDIVFDLTAFPSEAPIKWIQSKYNTVQFTLSLIKSSIEHFTHNGILTGELVILFEDNIFRVEFRTLEQKVVFRGTSAWINVSRISGYTKI